MSEQNTSTKKPRIYKYGSKKLDLEKYIKNIDRNVQSYILYKRQNDNWNDEQVAEFSKAYSDYFKGLQDQLASSEDRFYTDSMGTIIDTNNILSNQDTDYIDTDGNTGEYYYNKKGEQLNSSDYNQLKKSKQQKYSAFPANREVSTYFNKIGQASKEIPETDKFDINKHGFMSYLRKKYNPSGKSFDMTYYIDQIDPYDKNLKKRPINKRPGELATAALGYADYIKNLDLDFTDSDFENKEAFLAAIAQALNELNSGTYDVKDSNTLFNIGTPLDFIKKYFTTDEQYVASPEEKAQIEAEKAEKAKAAQLAALEKAKQQKISQNTSAQKAYIDRLYNDFRNYNYAHTDLNPVNIGTLDEAGFKNSNELWMPFYDDLNNFLSANWGDSFSDAKEMNPFVSNYINKEKIDSDNALKVWAGMIGNKRALPIKGGNLDGWYYMPASKNEKTHSFLVYNPTTGETARTFIANIPNEWNKHILQWKVNLGIVDPVDKWIVQEENGGSLPEFLQGGSIGLTEAYERNRLKRLTEEGHNNTFNTSYHSGRTKRQEEAGRRVVGAKATAEHPNNQESFTAEDYLRLSSAATDVASTIAALIPGAGTATGMGLGITSTLMTGAADVMEDGLDWGDVKSFGANLGLDLAGLVPGGGAASKFSKVIRNLKNLVPKIIAALGVSHTLINSDKIINSFLKIGQEDLTVDDWRNVATGINTVLGTTGSTAIYVKNKNRRYKEELANYKRNPNVKELVVVGMKDAKGLERKVLFAGDDAKEVKLALTSKNLDALKKATVDKFDEYKGWSLIADEGFGLRPFKNADGKLQFPFGERLKNIQSFLDLRLDKYGTYVRQPWYKDDVYVTGRKAKIPATPNTTTYEKQLFSEAIEKAKKVAPVIDKARTKLDKQISDIHSEINKSGDSTLLETKIKDAESDLEVFNNQLAWRDELRKSNTLSEKDSEQLALLEKDNLEKEIQAKKEELVAFKDKLNEVLELELKLDKKIYARNKIPDAYSGLYKNPKLREALKQTKPGKTEDDILLNVPGFKDPITRKISEILKKYDIKYAKGGSIKEVRKYQKGTEILYDRNKPKEDIYNYEVSPTLKYAIPRVLYLNKMNRKMGDLKLDSNIPYTVDAPQLTISPVRGDNSLLHERDLVKARFNHLRNLSSSSDSNTQQAVNYEYAIAAENKGNEFKDRYNASLNDSIKRNNDIKNKQIEENTRASNMNRLALLKSAENASSIKASTLASIGNNNRILGEQYEFEKRQEEGERKKYEQQYVPSDISNAVYQNLSEYTLLTPEEYTLWQLVVNGDTSVESIMQSPEQYSVYKNAYNKFQNARILEMQKYLNLPENKWSIARKMTTSKFTPKMGKLGTKLELQDIKRFLKGILDSNKLHLKNIDRVSKSLYTYIKPKLNK